MHRSCRKHSFLFHALILVTLLFPASSADALKNTHRLSPDYETTFTERYFQLHNFTSISSVLIQAPDGVENGSRFGESIDVIHHDSTHYAIIGAPHRNNKNGSVFLCAYEDKASSFKCEKDELPISYPSRNVAGGNGMLLGLSVTAASSDSNRGFGMYCGHLYQATNDEKVYFKGMCNLLSLNSRNEGPTPYSACRAGGCLAGFSSKLAITRDSEHLVMLIGAPSTEIGLGNVFIKKVPFIKPTRPDNNFKPKTSKDTTTFYRGFSTEIGYDEYGEKLYFVSTLKNLSVNDSKAKVEIFSESQRSGKIVYPAGEGFGWSLSAIDFSGSTPKRRKDLLVGEPFCNDPSAGVDAGCVHVYCHNMRNHTVLVGPEANGRFGTSVSRVGDINGDLFDDFVVGCPYCDDGIGTVFFFLGNKECSFKKPDQIIRARDFLSYANAPSISGFGMSLSPARDIDGNGNEDFLVGVPRSNLVVLVRSQTLFNITAIRQKWNCWILTDSEEVKNCILFYIFVVESVARSSYSDNFDLTLRFKYLLDSDLPRMKRLEYKGSHEYVEIKKVKLKKGRVKTFTLMQQRDFKLLTKHLRYDIATPLMIRCSVEIVLPEQSSIDRQYPLPQLAVFRGPWNSRVNISTKACGNKGCKSDMKVRIDSKESRGLIFYGSSNVSLPITVRNLGPDTPAESFVHISVMNGLALIELRTTTGRQVSCKSDREETEICNITAEVRGLVEAHFLVVMSALTLTQRSEWLRLESGGGPRVRLEVSSSWFDANRTNNNLTYHYQVIYDPMVTFSVGSASRQTVIDDRNSTYTVRRRERVYWERLGPQMKQVYQLANKGLSDVYGIRINISLPVSSEIGDRLVYLSSQVRIGGNIVPAGPRVISESGRSQGNCSIPSGFDNPMNVSIIGDSHLLTRIRRSVEINPAAASVFDSSIAKENGKSKVRVICGKKSEQFGTPRCVTIECTIDRLVKNDVLQVRLEGWLWAETMQKKYISDIEVMSSANGEMVEIPSVATVRNLSNLKIPSMNQSTQFIFSNVSPPTKTQLPIWIIILAIIVGIIILSCIILCLKKIGFFKRRRRPYATHNLRFMKYGESVSEMQENHYSDKNKMLPTDDESEDELEKGAIQGESGSSRFFHSVPPDDNTSRSQKSKLAPRSIDTGISDEVNSSSSSPLQALDHRDRGYESPSLGMSEDASI